MTIENEAVVEFIAIGMVAVDFHDFRDEAPARATFEVHDDVHGITDIGFDCAKVRPETTIATSESPRAMVLVNAC